MVKCDIQSVWWVAGCAVEMESEDEAPMPGDNPLANRLSPSGS
jgi:hypothetical protein